MFRKEFLSDKEAIQIDKSSQTDQRDTLQIAEKTTAGTRKPTVGSIT
jgi:hypothetical protein